MRTLTIAVLFLGAALAGCVDGDEPLEGARSIGQGPPSAVLFTPGGPAVAAAGAAGVATYTVTAFEGGEPMIGSTSTGTLFANAWDKVVRSRDGGATWEEVHAFGLQRLGVPERADPLDSNDPMLFVDPVTDRVYNAPMWPALTCVQLAWSDDEGETWTERPGVCHQPILMDHQKLGGGPPGPAGAPPEAIGLADHASVLYLCYADAGAPAPTTRCTMSYDGGLTWPVNRAVGEGGCAGLSGPVHVAADGTALIAMTEDCPRPHVGVSRDSGDTWSRVELPFDAPGDGSNPHVHTDDAGNVYVLWTSGHQRVHVARTTLDDVTDPASWTVVDATPPGIEVLVLPALVAGGDGRIAFAFIGTRDEADDPSRAPPDTRWHLFLVTSDDALASTPGFTARQVTPDEDPVQIGCVWMEGISVTVPPEEVPPEGLVTECRNLVDFIDATATPTGTVHVAYTEGCHDGCAFEPDATAEDSRSRLGAFARLDGWSLVG